MRKGAGLSHLAIPVTSRRSEEGSGLAFASYDPGIVT